MFRTRALEADWLQILALPLNRSVTLDKLLRLPMPQFLFCKIEAVMVLSCRVVVKPKCKVSKIVLPTLLLNKMLEIIVIFITPL